MSTQVWQNAHVQNYGARLASEAIDYNSPKLLISAKRRTFCETWSYQTIWQIVVEGKLGLHGERQLRSGCSTNVLAQLNDNEQQLPKTDIFRS